MLWSGWNLGVVGRLGVWFGCTEVGVRMKSVSSGRSICGH